MCCSSFASVMGGFLGLTIVYTYAASGEVTGLPIDIAWSFTNLWSGVGILVGPFFTGNTSAHVSEVARNVTLCGCVATGAVYDIRQNYDDVFFVIGSIFVVASVIFGAIPFVKRHSEQRAAANRGDAPASATERTYIVGDTKQTFPLPAHGSISKNSLNSDVRPAMTSHEYGTTDVTKPSETHNGFR